MRAIQDVNSLPTLDLSEFDKASGERRAFVDKLREAARDAGFFYLAGHGIDPALIHKTLTVARRFFDLPETDKLAVEMINSPRFRGYTRPGREFTRGEPDWREQLDVGAESARPCPLKRSRSPGIACKAPINGRTPFRN